MDSWLDRLTDRIGRFLDANVLEQRQVSGYSLTLPEWQTDKPRWLDANIGTYRAAFASQTAVYGCVGARARAVSSAPIRVYQEQDGDRTEIPDHPLRQLMNAPNPMMSEAEFMVMTQTLMDATGFAAIEKVRAASGAVVQLWHLRSDWLKEIRRSQRPSDWEYRVPGRDPLTLRAENVLIIPGGPSTDLGTIGMSPIAVALRELSIDAGLTDFLKLFVEAGGTPRYALVYPTKINSQEEADLIKERFGAVYGGFRNWTKTVLLSGGLDYKTIGSNIEEFAYPELRALTETHICSVFGVPPIIAGVQAGIDASTYSNYAQARKAFFEDTVVALWSRLDGALTRGLLSEFSDDQRVSLEFDTSNVPALQEDQTAVWARVQGLLGSAGMTINQAQAAVGLPGFGPAGDVLLLPISLQPTRPEDLAALADMTIEPPQPIPAALTGGGDDDDNDDAGSTDEGVAEGAERGDRPRNSAANGRAGEDVFASGADIRILTLPLESRSRIATGNRRNVSRLTAKTAPRLRAMFRRQGEEVAKAYAKRCEGIRIDGSSFRNGRKSAKTQMVFDTFVGRALEAVNWGDLESETDMELRALEAVNWDDLESEMDKELRALFEAAGKLAFSSAANHLGVGIDWSLSNPFVRQVLNQLARRVVGINQQTRKDVAEVVTKGLEDGLTTPQISERLRGLFTETYKGRSMAIARTESQVSYNLATATAYKESGIVMAMTCHDNINHVEPYGALDGLSCAQRDGVITDVDTVDLHIFSEHPNGTLAVSPLLVRPLGA